MSLDFMKVENNHMPMIAETYDANAAFAIYRNKNQNVVVYAARLLKDGTLDVYWIMFAQDGAPVKSSTELSARPRTVRLPRRARVIRVRTM